MMKDKDMGLHKPEARQNECAVGAHDRESDRWKRLYGAPGGPLMGWLLNEAEDRGMDLAALASELRVTVGFLAQLRSGIRDCANISRDFAAVCAVFLRVPTVVVLIVAGHLKLVDFVCATDFDHRVESTVGHESGEPIHLACGAQVGAEELRLLPEMVRALHAAGSVHETRSQVA